MHPATAHKKRRPEPPFFMGGCWGHECSSNVLLKTELPALAATAFHADLAIEMVVWAGWLPHRAVHAAAPQLLHRLREGRRRVAHDPV